MRIFSVYKTKSKTRVSEKTPKLAAKKFLEKKKVGTIIYLQEHPSEKVHGPYQKTSDKKIMKGGLVDNLGNCYDINYNGTPIYRQCNQYDDSVGLTNRTRSGILSNPRQQIPIYQPLNPRQQIPIYQPSNLRQQIPNYQRYINQQQIPIYQQYINQQQIPNYQQYINQQQMPIYQSGRNIRPQRQMPNNHFSGNPLPYDGNRT
jgi:hypothetical protein